MSDVRCFNTIHLRSHICHLTSAITHLTSHIPMSSPTTTTYRQDAERESELEQILSAALASANPEARKEALSLIDLLGRKGFLSFRELRK